MGRRRQARATGKTNPLGTVRASSRRFPDEFLADLARARGLLVVEEHARQGGMGQMIASLLLEYGQMPRRFASRTAQGYVSGLYGSQKFHRTESGIDPAAIIQFLRREDA